MGRPPVTIPATFAATGVPWRVWVEGMGTAIIEDAHLHPTREDQQSRRVALLLRFNPGETIGECTVSDATCAGALYCYQEALRELAGTPSSPTGAPVRPPPAYAEETWASAFDSIDASMRDEMRAVLWSIVRNEFQQHLGAQAQAPPARRHAHRASRRGHRARP